MWQKYIPWPFQKITLADSTSVHFPNPVFRRRNAEGWEYRRATKEELEDWYEERRGWDS